jgi:hypothetical protein
VTTEAKVGAFVTACFLIIDVCSRLSRERTVPRREGAVPNLLTYAGGLEAGAPVLFGGSKLAISLLYAHGPLTRLALRFWFSSKKERQ